ncbi:MAG: hypothetical protein R3C44_22920 [Chloroflexota bacterium]
MPENGENQLLSGPNMRSGGTVGGTGWQSPSCCLCLVRRHQDKTDGLTDDDAQLLRLLQWADEQN